MSEVAETVNESATEAVAEAPKVKKTRGGAKAAGAEASTEPKEKKERKPRAPRPEGAWDMKTPFQLTRGKLIGASIKVLKTEHKNKGKRGDFLNNILKSSTVAEALSMPASNGEYMDPGYITSAERNGFIEIIPAAQPAPAATA